MVRARATTLVNPLGHQTTLSWPTGLSTPVRPSGSLRYPPELPDRLQAGRRMAYRIGGGSGLLAGGARPRRNRHHIKPFQVGAPGFEPGTPCSQSTYKEGECLQDAHTCTRDADISLHRDPTPRNLHGIVRAIVRTLPASQRSTPAHRPSPAQPNVGGVPGSMRHVPPSSTTPPLAFQ